MSEFTVTWTLELEAETAAGAVDTALEWIRDDNAQVHCFTARNEDTGEVTTIDLNEEDL